MYRIGIDVGGTNTDTVVMRGRTVIATAKAGTTDDVASGLIESLQAALRQAAVIREHVRTVVIGTTQFTNAVIQRRGLRPTAVIRLCMPATQCLPPMVDWPEDLHTAIGDHTYLTNGGYEFDGRPISPLNAAEITRIGADIRAKGIDAVAICGVFSPINDAMERDAAALIATACPNAGITISMPIGRLGLLERENATILNSALLALASRTVSALSETLRSCGLTCPFYFSQNDGTLMDAQQVRQYPVLTIASGPTNSMRGAAFLTGHEDAIVLDIGGTTTDVGLLQRGFPRQASTVVDVGGVRTNFRMPDVFSLGLGGGSIVSDDGVACRIGPQSVGHEITKLARVFAGNTLTATDIIVAARRATVGDRGLVEALPANLLTRAQDTILGMLTAAVDRALISSAQIPVIAVGGGSILAPDRICGLEVIRPEHFSVANAIGAAIAQIGGETDSVFSIDGRSREEVLAIAEREARDKAIRAGAIPETLMVIDREDIPLTYLPGNATRIRVKVVGDLSG
jgi:N-methylhydantoinase A/oxoprolinase/acetone carboxylase beta subunit